MMPGFDDEAISRFNCQISSALPFAFKLRLSIPPLGLQRHQSRHFALSTGGRDGERGEGHDGVTEARAAKPPEVPRESPRREPDRGARDRVLAGCAGTLSERERRIKERFATT